MRFPPIFVAPPLILGLLVLACGGTTVQRNSDAGSGGTGDATGGTGGAASTCAATPPQIGDRCTQRSLYGGIQCSWGTDPRLNCRTTAQCLTNGTWLVITPDVQACADAPFPKDCPLPIPVQGTACDTPNRACHYADGTLCDCQTTDPPRWTCWPRPMGCPTIVPNAGTPCDTPGASCGAVDDCAITVDCQNGQWTYNAGYCPVCASPDTPIATPDGDREIAQLRAGDPVYSVDHDAVVVVPLLATGSTPVSNHHVMRVVLGDGTVLEMSPGHPTGQGIPFGKLSPGGAFDDLHRIRSAELVPYTHDRTYDILPDSTTGTYFAGGAWVGSTLGHARSVTAP